MSMHRFILTREQARMIILHAGGLARRAQFGKGREAVYKLIEHLGFIQLDTNYTVERAHHHAIASRIPDYRLEWLDQLQQDGRIFEFFTSDAGYMPMHDFRFSLPVKQALLSNRKPITTGEINLMNKVLDRVAREGPLMVKDFENDRQEARLSEGLRPADKPGTGRHRQDNADAGGIRPACDLARIAIAGHRLSEGIGMARSFPQSHQRWPLTVYSAGS